MPSRMRPPECRRALVYSDVCSIRTTRYRPDHERCRGRELRERRPAPPRGPPQRGRTPRKGTAHEDATDLAVHPRPRLWRPRGGSNRGLDACPELVTEPVSLLLVPMPCV